MSREQVVSTDGTRLTIQRRGAGEPVVMLHGSGGGLHSWESVADRLADEFEVWLIARRGYAPSDVPDRRKSFSADVLDVRAVLTAAGGGAGVHLVGASYGATLALHAAASNPPLLRSLSLWEPPLFAAGPDLRPVLAEYRARLAAGDRHGATVLLLERVSRVPPALLTILTSAATTDQDPTEAERSAVGWLHDLEALVDDQRDLSRWAAVTTPTLLMQGADTWNPIPETMDELAAALAYVRRVRFPGQMHFAPSTAPELVADTLRDFLRHQ